MRKKDQCRSQGVSGFRLKEELPMNERYAPRCLSVGESERGNMTPRRKRGWLR